VVGDAGANNSASYKNHICSLHSALAILAVSNQNSAREVGLCP
jgi:hypothetical protein